jgi:hypothetical protein
MTIEAKAKKVVTVFGGTGNNLPKLELNSSEVADQYREPGQ